MPRRFDRLLTSVGPASALTAAATVEVAPLAIATVTAVLREFLANALIRYSTATDLGDVSVTVVPPDRISTAADEPNQINLFLYRVAPHPVLARSGSRSSAEYNAVGPALDLHYLVTAYSSQDFHSDVLLGCAIHLLGSIPTLSGDVARSILQASTTAGESAQSPVKTALCSAAAIAGLGSLRVTQQFISLEEMSKLWSALQARYRPSVAYEVSSVTMPSEGRRP